MDTGCLVFEEKTKFGNIRSWFFLRINPEPWRVGPVSPGRRGNKIFATIGRDQQLSAFQDAIAEELGTHHTPIIGPVKIKFWFWRHRAEYTTPNQRKHRKHDADATNLQKAMEDALEGILFENDKQVNNVQSVIVQQGPDVKPQIIFSIEESSTPPLDVLEIPVAVHWSVKELTKESPTVSDNSWPPKEGL